MQGCISQLHPCFSSLNGKHIWNDIGLCSKPMSSYVVVERKKQRFPYSLWNILNEWDCAKSVRPKKCVAHTRPTAIEKSGPCFVLFCFNNSFLNVGCLIFHFDAYLVGTSTNTHTSIQLRIFRYKPCFSNLCTGSLFALQTNMSN